MTSPRQLKYLHAIGIPVWVSRELVVEKVVEDAVVEGEPCADSASSIIHVLDDQKATPVAEPTSTGSLKPARVNKEKNITHSKIECGNMDWQTLQQTVEACQLCSLHRTRTKTVFGSGDKQASWMIVGEAPGAQEDSQGQPFVGEAGQLLTNMLKAIGLNREEVYLANILKCRPPNNRDPEVEESASCNAYIQRQLELIKPDIILLLGRVAGQHLLQSKEPLARLRAKVHRLPGTETPVIATYHPAYLLRKPDNKRKAWEDLKLARSVYQNTNQKD